MKERSSRYAVTAGSEEIEVVPEGKEIDENRIPSDDDYSPPFSSRSTVNNKKRCVTNNCFEEDVDDNSPSNNRPMLSTSVQDSSSPSLNALTKSKYGLLRYLFASIHHMIRLSHHSIASRKPV